MKRWQAGLVLAALFALMCYVGPSEAGSVNLKAGDCQDARCYP